MDKDRMYQNRNSNFKLLLLTVKGSFRGGREQLSAMLAETLSEICNVNLETFELNREGSYTKVSERLRGRIDGVNYTVENDLMAALAKESFDCVILDGSNLGRLAKLIKRKYPEIRIITFYHNVEVRFFFDLARASPSFKAAGVLFANFLTERWATHYSDKRIMLNRRDSDLLAKIYGVKGADVVPIAVRDCYSSKFLSSVRPHSAKYALFVGGDFYANVQGMLWYAKNIAPKSPLLTVVVGRGMERHKTRLERWGGVEVVGEVNDLGPWYAHAQLIVAPILSGSGMKTKTAEALMHGKSIVGSPEAFVGYTKIENQNINICNTELDFLSSLHSMSGAVPNFSQELRDEYQKNHSKSAMKHSLSDILLPFLRSNRCISKKRV